jgi:2-C-methyl-D-erythritol 2,4-cyclodiphosphate synthase
MRIGQGYDAHRFAPGRPLILGGVDVPHDFGLAAHSDGDVLVHALCDAILGAAALGDIGKHFPDNSEQFRDINSRVLLREVVGKITQLGLDIGNIDLTVVAQAPKLAPHIDDMRRNLAEDLGVELNHVSVKATTTEGMGFAGRGEGIACYAVVLLNQT